MEDIELDFFVQKTGAEFEYFQLGEYKVRNITNKFLE
jgi:hypothetical protein